MGHCQSSPGVKRPNGQIQHPEEDKISNNSDDEYILTDLESPGHLNLKLKNREEKEDIQRQIEELEESEENEEKKVVLLEELNRGKLSKRRRDLNQSKIIGDDLQALFDIFHINSISLTYRHGRFLAPDTIFYGSHSSAAGLYQITNPLDQQRYFVKSLSRFSVWFHEKTVLNTIATAYPKGAEHYSLPELIGARRKYIVLKYYPINATLFPELHEKLIHKQAWHLLQAVYNLRRIGIFHRDIRRDNIVFTDERKPILIDYGLSSIFPMAKVGDFCLCQTTAYRAPEIIAQQIMIRSKDQSSEIYKYSINIEEWSLGLCFVPYMDNLDMSRRCRDPSFVHLQHLAMPEMPDIPKHPFLEKNPLKRPRLEPYLDRVCITRYDMCANNFLATKDKLKSSYLTLSEMIQIAEYVDDWTDFFFVITFFAQLGQIGLALQVFKILQSELIVDQEIDVVYSINHPYFFVRMYLLQDELDQILDYLIWCTFKNFHTHLFLQVKYLLAQAGRIIDFTPEEKEWLDNYWSEFDLAKKNVQKPKFYFRTLQNGTIETKI